MLIAFANLSHRRLSYARYSTSSQSATLRSTTSSWRNSLTLERIITPTTINTYLSVLHKCRIVHAHVYVHIKKYSPFNCSIKAVRQDTTCRVYCTCRHVNILFYWNVTLNYIQTWYEKTWIVRQFCINRNSSFLKGQKIISNKLMR